MFVCVCACVCVHTFLDTAGNPSLDMSPVTRHAVLCLLQECLVARTLRVFSGASCEILKLLGMFLKTLNFHPLQI
jgi:hypothetical protein